MTRLECKEGSCPEALEVNSDWNMTRLECKVEVITKKDLQSFIGI